MRYLTKVAVCGLSTTLSLGLTAAPPGSTASVVVDERALSDLLKAQTQAFSNAGLKGDGATLAKYLDPKVVFTNESGATVTKKEIVEGASPAADHRHLEVTEWRLTLQGDVATSTFVDVLTQRSGEQTLVYRYHSTEVWAERQEGWRMIASQTMVVPTDPPAIQLASADIQQYVGLYQTTGAVKIRISRSGAGLVSSTDGAPPRPLEVEARDVLFTPGTAPGLRIFQRDAAGHITGFIARRDGNDLRVGKIG